MSTTHTIPPTVLITGVSTGIGRAIAVHLLARGWQVWGSVRRAADARDLIEKWPQHFRVLVFDVTDAGARQMALQQIKASNWPHLHALVNNAGVAIPGPLECIPEADVRRQFDINVFAPLALTRECLPLLHHTVAQHTGWPVRIVNISSVSGIIVSPFLGLYVMSKFALESMTHALRRELSTFGISAIAIQPGPIQSEIWQKVQGQGASFLATRYRPWVSKTDQQAARSAQRALPAERVAVVVHHALTSARPRPHYLVVRQAWKMKVFCWLPTSWQDRLFARGLASIARSTSG